MFVLDRLRIALDWLAAALLALSMLLLAAMLVLINVEVAGRYLFAYSTLISDEYSGYLFTWIVLCGFLYALRSESLLRVNLVVARTSGRVRDALEVINAACGVALAAIATYGAWQTFSISWLFQTASSHASQTPLYIPQVILPIGMGLLGLAFLEELIRRALVLFGIPAARRGQGPR